MVTVTQDNALSLGTQPGAGKASDLYGTSTPLGSGVLGKYGTSLSGTPTQDMFAKLFSGLGSTALGAAGTQLGSLDTSKPFDLQAAFGAFNNAGMGSLGSQFLGQAGQLGDYFKNFNVDTATQNYLDKMNAAALPAEQTASNKLADRLFSAGRVGSGDTTAGAAFGELAKAQDQAAAQRYLGARSGALADQNQIGQLAQLFANLGGNLTTQGQTNTQNAYGALRADQDQQMQWIANLFDIGNAAQTGSQNAYAPLRDLFTMLTGVKGGTTSAYSAMKAGEAENANPWTSLAQGVLTGVGTAAGGPIGGAIASGVGNLFNKPAQTGQSGFNLNPNGGNMTVGQMGWGNP